MLTISTETKNENFSEGRTYNRKEYSYSAFTRSFTLPESADIEKISASYNDGILKLELPKKEEAKAVARKIEIQ